MGAGVAELVGFGDESLEGVVAVGEDVACSGVGFLGFEVSLIVAPAAGVAVSVGEAEQVVVGIVAVGDGDVVGIGGTGEAVALIVDHAGGMAFGVGAEDDL